MKTEPRIDMDRLYEIHPMGSETEGRFAYAYGAVALVGIWAAVIVTSLFAPDLVTGTTQDHFPLAFVVALIAGLIGTRAVVRAFTQRIGGTGRWAVYTVSVLAIWLAVALVSIYAPVTVTGTDPTRLPIAAIVAPIVGGVLTGAVTELFAALRR